MDIETIGAIVVCVILIATMLDVALRVLRPSDELQREQAMDKLIEQEQKRLKAIYGK
jgi:hypothetical protein